MPISYMRYVGKVFYPANLSVFYPYPNRWPTAVVWISIALFIAIWSVILFLGGERQYLLFGWLFFVVTLLPVIGLMQAGVQSIADRYTYIPSIGILVAVVWYAGELLKPSALSRASGYLAVVVLAVLCILQTRQQISYWQNGETLFRHAAAVTENNYLAYSMIGYFDLSKSNNPAAMTNFRRALRINDSEINARIGLGIALSRSGQNYKAIEILLAAVSQEPLNPRAHGELAATLLSVGRREEALTNLLFALRLKPDYAEAQKELLEFTNFSSRPVGH